MSRNSLSGRNTYVDALRGIAMLLVVLGHTMTGCTEGSQQSFLFQVVWSLQMPMFILISGYVTRYGSEIKEFKGLIKFARKRTIAYLWPWVVWTVFVRGIIFGNKLFLNPSYILWHMDSGYWFLFSIWTISMIFGISQFLAGVIAKNKTGTVKVIYIGVVYLMGMFLLTGLGFAFGLSFLGIKLTLYYMPFYFLGYLYGKLQDQLFKFKSIDNWIELIVAISFIVWIGIITRFNLYDISDNGLGVAIRAVASLFGCIAVFGLLKSVLMGGAIVWCGKHSLEIYLTHYLMLNLFQAPIKPQFMTVNGALILLANFVITVCVTCVIIALINQNKFLRTTIFGRMS